MSKRFELLANMQANGTYHVFNRTNNQETLFLDDEDHHQFLSTYNRFLSGYVTTYAWALLPNHFHFVISVAEEPVIRQLLRKLPTDSLTYMEKQFLMQKAELVELVRMQWTRLFISYSIYFNKKYGRSGNLFFRSFKRKSIVDQQQLHDTIIYVHINPLKHAVAPNWQKYPWSSWRTITRRKQTPVALDLELVLHLFEGPNTWLEDHIQSAQRWETERQDTISLDESPAVPNSELVSSAIIKTRRSMLYVPGKATTPIPSPRPSL